MKMCIIYEENNKCISNKIFFARSNFLPKGWSYDHVGFVINNGFIQMSGHRISDEVYVTKNITDDKNFSSNHIKIIDLPKFVQFTKNNTLGSENCGTFVYNVLKINGINMPLQKIYSIFKNGK